MPTPTADEQQILDIITRAANGPGSIRSRMPPGVLALYDQYGRTHGDTPGDVEGRREWMGGFVQSLVDELRQRQDRGDRGDQTQELFTYLQTQAPSVLGGEHKKLDADTGDVRDDTWWERNGHIVLGYATVLGAGFGGAALFPGGAATLPSTAIAPTTGTLPIGAASGAVPAAFGTSAGAGAGAGTAAGTGAAVGGAEAGGLLASTNAGVPAIGTLPAGTASGAVPAAMAGGGAAAGSPAWQRIADTLRAGGQNVGAATNAANERRLSVADKYLDRSKEEDRQRRQDLSDVYRAAWYGTRQAGPYNMRGLQQLSPEYQDTLNLMSQRGRDRLGRTPTYDIEHLPSLEPGGLEEAGNWIAPTLSTIGTIASIYGNRRYQPY